MFGLEFLYSAALFALPLAGLPILLHLLFRRKSPVMQFSTLRFLKSSMQRTAARRRVQQWLLLACRALLVALLIWAVSQPAKKVAAGWSQTGQLVTAAIVVDTSYSMQFREGQDTLLSRASIMTEDLLRTQLRDAKVAFFKSGSAIDNQPEQIRPASEVLRDWVPLTPQADRRPLLERVSSAIELLNRNRASEKWLVVISDFQGRKFPQSFPTLKDGRVILLDLHPASPRSSGVTRIALDPAQPVPGIGSEAVVDLIGRAGESSVANLSITKLSGDALGTSQSLPARADPSGRARVRLPLRLPAERWTLLRASIEPDDALSWDNTRQELIEIAPRQTVTLFDSPALPAAQRFVRLALDPTEGKLPSWPLLVKSLPDLALGSSVAVQIASSWPDVATTTKLINFVRGGGTLIWFLRPGLEQTWDTLPEPHRRQLLELLPGAPAKLDVTHASTVSIAGASDPALAGLTDERFQIGTISVRRFVPFSGTDGSTSTLLNVAPVDVKGVSRLHGLLFRKPFGNGTAFTFATAPDSLFTNLETHPIFLPLLVRMALRPMSQSDAQNIELGQSLILAGARFDGYSALTIETPESAVLRVAPTVENSARRFEFTGAATPGLYRWRAEGVADPITITNVQLPASEAQLVYKPANTLADAGPGLVIASSLEGLQTQFSAMGQSQPQWNWAVAAALLLLCAEAFMGSMSRLWKAPKTGAFVPKLAQTSGV